VTVVEVDRPNRQRRRRRGKSDPQDAITAARARSPTNVIATTGSHNIRAADIDRDGDVDLVGANDDPSPIELRRNLLIP
jgi:hypothetical protein